MEFSWLALLDTVHGAVYDFCWVFFMVCGSFCSCFALGVLIGIPSVMSAHNSICAKWLHFHLYRMVPIPSVLSGHNSMLLTACCLLLDNAAGLEIDQELLQQYIAELPGT